MTRARAIAVALLALAATVPAGRAQAQNAVLTGRVTTEFGQPLEGANVFITEMQISVGTVANGTYTVTIPAARVSGQSVNLRVRSFGYVPQSLPIRLTPGRQTFNFSLKQDVNRLQEVVVTGVTGATEQKKLAFTVAHVDESQMPVPGANPLTQLQGKVAGVSIMSTSGRPGASESVLLRGPQSINGSGRGQSPLYIVDGIEINGALPDINPQDIESVEVVKGAAAASLYGSRAGNGVIQITTKSGKNLGDGVRFSAREEYGRGDIEHEYHYAKGQFLTMDESRKYFCVGSGASAAYSCPVAIDFQKEALRVNELGGDFALGPTNFGRDGGIGQAPTQADQRGLFQANWWPTYYNPVAATVTPGASMNTAFDATGRISNTSFFASANNFQQEGSIRFLPGYKRNSLRLNLDQSLGNALTFGLRTYYVASAANGGVHEDGGSAFFRLTRVPAGVDLLRTDKDGRLFIRSNPLNQGGQNQNPLYLFQNIVDQDKRNRFLGALNASYKPFSWVDFDANASYDNTATSTFYLQDKGFRTTSADPTTNNGYIEQLAGSSTAYNVSANGTAHHTFGRDLLARLTARYLYEQQDGLGNDVWGYNLVAPGLSTLNAATDLQNDRLTSSESSVRSIGLTSGIDFEYKERYIFGAMVRKDGSSLFGANHRWATYGRGSLAWRVSDEPWWFMPTALNDLKLRYSVGTAGGRPSFSAQYETFGIGNNAGTLTASTLGNKNLRPETVTETETGVDGEIFSRIGFTVNYARSISRDQILPVPPSFSSGFSNQWKNAGTLENKTWEASVNVPIIRQRNLSWSVRANFDRNRAYITRLDVPEFFGGPNEQGATSMFKYASGERYGTIYGRRFVTECSQLPDPFRSQCGGSNGQFQKNSDGMIVWTAGQSLGSGITGNYWQARLPQCVVNGKPLAATVIGATTCAAQGGQTMAPWGFSLNWGMPIILRDSTGTAVQSQLGNALPDYRLSISQTFNYKKLFVYGLLDGSYGRRVWNEGRAWSFGDFMTAEEDQLGKTVADAKPLGYYWRAGPGNSSGQGGLYDVLGPNSVTTEDASYLKIRELNVSYNVGSVKGMGDFTISAIGRNLHTFTRYKGFDPEVGFGGGTGGSSQLNALDAYTFPNLRTFTFAISTRF